MQNSAVQFSNEFVLKVFCSSRIVTISQTKNKTSHAILSLLAEKYFLVIIRYGVMSTFLL